MNYFFELKYRIIYNCIFIQWYKYASSNTVILASVLRVLYYYCIQFHVAMSVKDLLETQRG